MKKRLRHKCCQPEGLTANSRRIEEVWSRMRYSTEQKPSGWFSRPTNPCSRQTSLEN